MQKHQHATKISVWYSCWFYPLMPHYLLTILTTSPFLVGKRTRRVGNWTHVLSVFGVHFLDIGCETHGFGKQFSSWYSPCHCVLAFFVRFAMFSAFMSFQNQRLFSAVFLNYAGFNTFLRAFFSIAKDSHLDWTVSFKTLAVFWNKLVPVFFHLHCQGLQCLIKAGL